MKKSAIKTKKLLLLLVLLILIAPFIQQQLSLVRLKPLKGAVSEPTDAPFSAKKWFSGEYQEEKEKYLNEAFGFRSFFIRVNNQVAYSLFSKAKANGVIVGKENYLFEENYIKAYYGDDYIGNDSIANRMQKLKMLSDTLAAQNKTLMLVFAAGKGSFYPEYFPERMQKAKNKVTNYEKHVELAQKLNLNFIDFNKYFVDHKQNSKYPLYPQYGIHWSYYGSCLAADSIIKYIEKKRNIDLPDFYWKDIEMDKPRGDDRDIENGMNIIVRQKTFPMAYPKLQFGSDEGKVKPAVMVISDSFYWGMFGFGISNLFSPGHFWYYNKEIYPESAEKKLDTDQVDLEAELKKHDVIIIMGTEATLPGFGWGFIEDAYNLYFKGIKKDNAFNKEYQQKLAQIRNYILNDKNWMEKIAQKAKANNVSVDSMLTLDAIWVYKDQKKK